MTGFIPKEKLTAYQRWELAAFDEDEPVERPEAAVEPVAEAMTGSAPSPSFPTDDPPVTLPTAADIERIHNEAHAQGYTAGYEEGLTEAHAIEERLSDLTSSLEQAIAGVEQNVAEQLLATAVEIARHVLRQSLQIKPELLLPSVREAVAALQFNSGHPALLAHPEDVALIRQHMGDRLAHSNWRIIEDPSITRGGCRVELGASAVDATLETRWKRVIETIGSRRDWLDDKD